MWNEYKKSLTKIRKIYVIELSNLRISCRIKNKNKNNKIKY